MATFILSPDECVMLFLSLVPCTDLRRQEDRVKTHESPFAQRVLKSEYYQAQLVTSEYCEIRTQNLEFCKSICRASTPSEHMYTHPPASKIILQTPCKHLNAMAWKPRAACTLIMVINTCTWFVRYTLTEHPIRCRMGIRTCQ